MQMTPPAWLPLDRKYLGTRALRALSTSADERNGAAFRLEMTSRNSVTWKERQDINMVMLFT